MSEADDVLLGRADLEQAFTALGERLARRGVVADVFIVGGAAMALAYDASRVTRDVDARFLPHGIVLEEARRVADDLGLPPWWLNEQASVYISGKDDLGKRRVFDHPGLRVMARLATAHLRHESTGRPDTRHRRPPPARRHHWSGILRPGPADMRRLLPRRIPIPQIHRSPPGTLRLSTHQSKA